MTLDPNETLAKLREALKDPTDIDGELVAHLFARLDEWLMRGGFMPRDWVTTW